MRRISKINELKYLHKTNRDSVFSHVVAFVVGYTYVELNDIKAHIYPEIALRKNNMDAIKKHYENGKITDEDIEEKYVFYDSKQENIIKNPVSFVTSTIITSIATMNEIMPNPYVTIICYLTAFIIGWSPIPSKWHRDNYKYLINNVKKTS